MKGGDKKLTKVSGFPLKRKKGVSIMIGYILLITFVIVISILVYQWLKTYIPKENIECPDGVSVYVSDAILDPTNNILILTLKLKNNGRFNIDGVIVYYSDYATQEIATKNLGGYLLSGGAFTGIGISFGEPPLKAGEEINLDFNAENLNIKFIELTPTRIETIKNKEQTVTCTNAKVKKIIG